MCQQGVDRLLAEQTASEEKQPSGAGGLSVGCHGAVVKRATRGLCSL